MSILKTPDIQLKFIFEIQDTFRKQQALSTSRQAMIIKNNSEYLQAQMIRAGQAMKSQYKILSNNTIYISLKFLVYFSSVIKYLTMKTQLYLFNR